MATKKQKQELIDTLKFTPVKVTMMIQGYGGEAYAGKVDRAVYNYFAEKKIDIEEYASDWDGNFSDRVPQELQPFSPGSPYDCDSLFHASGAELSDLNEIRVDDSNGNEIWVHNCGYSNLEESGVTVESWGGEDLDDLADGEVAFWGGQGEKGCFFEAEFTLRAPFDPKKLKISYENCDGWYIINLVEYDGEELDGSGGYGTTGKWSESKWILGDGVDAYEPVSSEDEAHETGTDNPIDFPESDCDSETEEEIVASMPELPLTDWYPVATKPVRKGEYEVRNTHTPVWPFPATFRAEWTGRTWKDSDGKKVPNIIDWRGLAIDPNVPLTFDCECVQCDWKGTVDECNDWDGQMCCPECGEPVEFL